MSKSFILQPVRCQLRLPLSLFRQICVLLAYKLIEIRKIEMLVYLRSKKREIPSIKLK